MLHVLFLLPLADFKTVKAPPPRTADSAPDTLLSAESVLSSVSGVVLIVLAFGLLYVFVRLRSTLAARFAKPVGPKNWIVVDGSNVMHWQDNTPQLAPLLCVIEDLKKRGFAPGVVFDANAGYKLFGKYLDERELSRMLVLPLNQLLVVPKGIQADPYIIETALKFNAPIVTNDRFRDWAETYPEVTEPGFLIWGGIKEGKPWLRYPDLSPGTALAKADATVG